MPYIAYDVKLFSLEQNGFQLLSIENWAVANYLKHVHAHYFSLVAQNISNEEQGYCDDKNHMLYR